MTKVRRENALSENGDAAVDEFSHQTTTMETYIGADAKRTACLFSERCECGIEGGLGIVDRRRNFDGHNIDGPNFGDCNINGPNFDGCNPGGPKFNDNFEYWNLSSCNSNTLNFLGCFLSGHNLSHRNIDMPNLDHCKCSNSFDQDVSNYDERKHVCLNSDISNVVGPNIDDCNRIGPTSDASDAGSPNFMCSNLVGPNSNSFNLDGPSFEINIRRDDTSRIDTQGPYSIYDGKTDIPILF